MNAFHIVILRPDFGHAFDVEAAEGGVEGFVGLADGFGFGVVGHYDSGLGLFSVLGHCSAESVQLNAHTGSLMGRYPRS